MAALDAVSIGILLGALLVLTGVLSSLVALRFGAPLLLVFLLLGMLAGEAGLRLGEIVYDGPPAGLTAEVLTQIYGEEDWSATIRTAEDDEAESEADNVIALDMPLPHRDRLAGLT